MFDFYNYEKGDLISIETKDSFYSVYFNKADSKYLYFNVSALDEYDVSKVLRSDIINVDNMEYLMNDEF